VLTGYSALGDENWTQTDGRIDAYVQGVGTGGSLRGTAEALRLHGAAIRIVAVEPAESAVLYGGPPGANLIEGIGMGYVVPLRKPGLADEIIPVPAATRWRCRAAWPAKRVCSTARLRAQMSWRRYGWLKGLGRRRRS